MVADVIVEGLERYAIGAKIRALRTARKLGLSQLGAHTGLSSGMLSKIERGQLFPTLPTLLRIAMVFGVGLDHFFTDGAEPLVAIVRKKDRLRLPDRPKGDPSYFFESLDFPVNNRRMEAYYAVFDSAAASDPHSHPGAEFLYVIEGRLAITVESNRHILEAGDSMYFDGSREHSYCRDAPGRCSAVVVVARDPD